MKYVFEDKFQLVRYVEMKYKQIYGEEISQIKLHQTLYFLYGYYAIEEHIKLNFQYRDQSRLFNANFFSSRFGIIEYDVKYNYKYGKMFIVLNKTIGDFLNEKMEKIFKITSFTLVNISHSHNVWKKYYSKSSEEKIPLKEIEECFIEIANLKENNDNN